MKLQEIMDSSKKDELLKKLHKSKNLPPKQLAEIVNSFGWKAEFKNIFFQKKHLRYSDDIEQLLGKPGFRVSVFDDNKDPITYDFCVQTQEDAQAVYDGLKKIEVSKLPENPKRTQSTVVIKLTPVEKLNETYYHFKVTAQMYFMTKALVLKSDKGTEATIHDDNQYNFIRTEFHKELMNKVNEVLGLEDYETEQNKKREAARIASTKGEIGHCPICGKLQKIKKVGNKYKMVHHGFKRPGHGYIIGDCFGVGHMPYELSSEGNKAYAPVLEKYLKDNQSQLKRLESGNVTSLSRGNEVVTVNDKNWESTLKSAINGVTQTIKYIEQDIVHNQKMIDDWVEKELPKTGKIED